MANKDGHLASGLLLGLGMARSWSGRSWQYGLGFLSGVAGGSILPDTLDPPVTPRHRDAGHSLVLLWVVGMLGISGEAELAKLLAGLMRKALAFQEAGCLPPRDLRTSIGVNDFLQGYVKGVAVGMGAHLGMDALTPDGIRLLNRSL